METETYQITIKEVGKSNLLKPTYSGENITKEFLIEFFGLNNPDVEWYKIEKI